MKLSDIVKPILTIPKIRVTRDISDPKIIPEKEPINYDFKYKVGFLNRIRYYAVRTWRWIDGKKLIIGGGIVLIGEVVLTGGMGILVKGIGYALAGVGAVHGAAKLKKDNGKGTWELVLKMILDLIKQYIAKRKGG